jgi:hypothetical protein
MERIMREQYLYYSNALEEKKMDEQVLKTELELFKASSCIGNVLYLLNNKNVEFQQFCKKCKAEGFWNFWIDAEKFRNSKLDKEEIVKEATIIFENYFGTSTQNKIKIDSEVSIYLNEKIKNCDQNVFRTIQKDVLLELEEKIYPQYVSIVKKNLIMEDETEMEEIFIN